MATGEMLMQDDQVSVLHNYVEGAHTLLGG